jgi:hypothetical protein
MRTSARATLGGAPSGRGWWWFSVIGAVEEGEGGLRSFSIDMALWPGEVYIGWCLFFQRGWKWWWWLSSTLTVRGIALPVAEATLDAALF